MINAPASAAVVPVDVKDKVLPEFIVKVPVIVSTRFADMVSVTFWVGPNVNEVKEIAEASVGMILPVILISPITTSSPAAGATPPTQFDPVVHDVVPVPFQAFVAALEHKEMDSKSAMQLNIFLQFSANLISRVLLI
ncbi:hypothetical protein GCM10028826_32270 [Mucilaginibacter boryungensis]